MKKVKKIPLDRGALMDYLVALEEALRSETRGKERIRLIDEIEEVKKELEETKVSKNENIKRK